LLELKCSWLSSRDRAGQKQNWRRGMGSIGKTFLELSVNMLSFYSSFILASIPVIMACWAYFFKKKYKLWWLLSLPIIAFLACFVLIIIVFSRIRFYVKSGGDVVLLLSDFIGEIPMEVLLLGSILFSTALFAGIMVLIYLRGKAEGTLETQE
jgi:hypothetical protein